MPDTITRTPRLATSPTPRPRLRRGEKRSFEKSGPSALLTVCIPTFRDDPSALIAALGNLYGARQVALIVFDDGSNDQGITDRTIRALSGFPGAGTLITARHNQGRSHVRNRLAALAATDWLLFLDADMRPDHAGFLVRYADLIRTCCQPALFVGGFTVSQTEKTPHSALHHAQSIASDCQTAERRAADPGRFVFTSNILVHRDILETVRFDPDFTGWGWEDVDWGLRVAEAFSVEHIDNTASHLGLIDNARLVDRFTSSTANFVRLAAKHPKAVQRMPLYRMARRCRRLPLRQTLLRVCRSAARGDWGWLPLGMRLKALKLARAIAYSAALEDDGET